jgi:hypothetical protein
VTINGVDYPWRHPGGAALAAAGKEFAFRYLSHDVSKTLMRPEADDLAAHGIAMAVVYEDAAQRATDGQQAGVNDAVAAKRMTKGTLPGYTDLAMPDDRPIYFACDFDAQWSQVQSYLAGAALAIGKDRVGVYGGLNVVTGAHNAGYKWLWQTGAWSHGLWHPAAQVRQLIETQTIGGVECDVDVAMTTDYGQWTPGGDPVTPADIQAIVEGVWNHAEMNAETNRLVRMGAVLRYEDAVHAGIERTLKEMQAQITVLQNALKKQ